ncbi:MAG: DUF433 domain-containing protein [Acidobacteriaceae bacterium]
MTIEKAYSPAEASAVAKLPLRAVHKLIDSRLIRPHKLRRGNQVQRLLSPEQLVYLRLEAEGVRLLPMDSRREVARAIESGAGAGADLVAVSGSSVLFVQVKGARKDVERELKRLRKVEQMVVSDPEVMGGTPVYRSSRIPVDLVATMLAQGATVEEILEGYPALSREQVELAPLYVAAFPRRGRPARRPWAKQKAVNLVRSTRAIKT